MFKKYVILAILATLLFVYVFSQARFADFSGPVTENILAASNDNTPDSSNERKSRDRVYREMIAEGRITKKQTVWLFFSIIIVLLYSWIRITYNENHIISPYFHKSNNVRYFCVSIAIIAILALGLRLYKLETFQISSDEAGSMETFPVLSLVNNFETYRNPPLHRAIVRLVRNQTRSLWWFRFPSVIAGTGAVVLTAYIGWRWFGLLVGIVSGLAAALSPSLIYYSQIGRAYVFAALFGLAACYHFREALNSGRQWPWDAYMVLMTAALWSQYFCWALVVANVLYGLYYILKNTYLKELLNLGVSHLCILLLNAIFIERIYSGLERTKANYGRLDSLTHINTFLRECLYFVFGYWQLGALALLLSLIMCCILVMLKDKSIHLKDVSEAIGYLLFNLSTGILALVIMSQYLMVRREYLQFLIPIGLIFIVASLLCGLQYLFNRKIAAIVGVALVLTFVGTGALRLNEYYPRAGQAPTMFHAPPLKPLVDKVRREITAGSRFLISPEWHMPVFLYHATRLNTFEVAYCRGTDYEFCFTDGVSVYYGCPSECERLKAAASYLKSFYFVTPIQVSHSESACIVEGYSCIIESQTEYYVIYGCSE